MQIIERYLLRQFLQTFAICFCSLTGLFIVIDGFGNLEEFITFAAKEGRRLLAVMAEYYSYRSLSFFDRTSSVLTLISAMFTLTWIQRHNELTALEAAGISKGRVVRPVIVAVAAISLLSVANRELLIPRVREELSRNAQDLGGATAKNVQPRYDQETDVLFRGVATFADQRRIQKPSFLLPSQLDRYGKQLMAEDAFYQPAADGHPGGYLFQKVEQPKDLAGRPSLSLAGKQVVLSPFDTPWLKPDECFLVSAVSFEQLEGGSSWRQLSSTLDLIRGLHNPSLDFGADVRVAIHARLVQPVLDLTLLFLGLPLVLARENRNMFMAIGMCLAVVVGFMLVVMGCQWLGSSYWLSPALAAWLPVMIFVPCAVACAEPLREQ